MNDVSVTLCKLCLKSALWAINEIVDDLDCKLGWRIPSPIDRDLDNATRTLKGIIEYLELKECNED